MKKIIIFIAVLSTCLCVIGQSPEKLISNAKSVNSNYRLYELNQEKNQLDYDKALIEAMDKKAEITAEISRLEGETKTQENLTSFYSDILNHIFEVKTQEINQSISEISLKIAELDYNDSLNLFDKGLISANELKDASITLRDAKTDLEQTEGDLEWALKEYKSDLGIPWEPVDLFVPDYTDFIVDEVIWLEKTKEVQIGEYNMEMADFDIQNLSLNASRYDEKLADISLEQNKIQLNIAKEKALKQKRDLEDSLYFYKKQMETLQERLSLSKDDLEDVKNRYQKGLVSDTQLYNQQKSHFDVLSQYNTTLKSYWTTLSNYIISSSQDVEEVLRKNLEKVESEALENE